MTKTVEVYDNRLLDLISENVRLGRLATGAKHSEGSVYLQENDSVIWSDVSGNQLLQWSPQDGVEIICDPSHYQNGRSVNPEKRLPLLVNSMVSKNQN